LKAIEKILGYLNVVEKWAGGICFLLLTLLMFSDVAKREVIDNLLNGTSNKMQAFADSSVAKSMGDWAVNSALGIKAGAESSLNWIGAGGIIWAQKLALYFMLWGGLFGTVCASAKGAHLRPEIADKLLPKAIMPYVKIIEQLVISGFFLFLSYLSFLYIGESIEQDEVNPVTEIHLWKVQLIFPYIFSSMGLRHLLYGIFPSLAPEEINEASEALELAEHEFEMGMPHPHTDKEEK
jgi:TRAP-type C4-dicarboxylate transport system permease small subunit